MVKAVFIDFYGTVVHIGDSLSSDVLGAASIGINAIWLNRKARKVPEGVIAVGNLLEVFGTDFFRQATNLEPQEVTAMQNIIMQPIGYVRNNVEAKKDISWGEDVSTIMLNEEYYTGLKGLEDFSHVIVIYHLDKAKYEKEKHLQRRPQNREDMPLVGIFSQRGKDRPNRIGMTSVQIISADERSLTVKGLDAIDGTPVLDIKPYYPVYDKKDAAVPDWVTRLMEHYF